MQFLQTNLRESNDTQRIENSHHPRQIHQVGMNVGWGVEREMAVNAGNQLQLEDDWLVAYN